MIKLLNQIREKTSLVLHCKLEEKNGWYLKWHQHPYHKHVHLAIFLIISALFFSSAYGSYVKNIHTDDNVVTEETIPILETPPVEETVLLVDTPPVQTSASVTGVSTSLADGIYKYGIIPIEITFSEPVVVTGLPQLAMLTGYPKISKINYASGSGTNILVFKYFIAPGNFSSDLDYRYSLALTLNGGTIKNQAGNNAMLKLARPSTPGSLSVNSKIVINTELGN